jgi:hypothetical protein
MALAPQTADDFDLADVIGIGGHEIPHHHAKEVQVDAPAVNKRQL